MKKHLTFVCAAAMAAEAFAFAAAPAFAAPVKVEPAVATAQPLVTEVRHRGRRHSNAGAVIGGFAAGAIVGGIIASQRPRYYYEPHYYVEPRVRYVPRSYYSRSHGLSRHDQWCLNRYRSYDPVSNTYQPYHGPRRYCNSPYN